MSEVNYKYVRGVGWVAETVPVYQHDDLSTWTTKDGRILLVRDMGDSHVVNARNLVAKKLRALETCDWCENGWDLVFDEACVRCEGGKKERFKARIAAFDEELKRRRILVDLQVNTYTHSFYCLFPNENHQRCVFAF